MILDIRYTDKAPEQIQGVRHTTVYAQPDSGVEPELVIHFYDSKSPRFIPMSTINLVNVTND